MKYEQPSDTRADATSVSTLPASRTEMPPRDRRTETIQRETEWLRLALGRPQPMDGPDGYCQ